MQEAKSRHGEGVVEVHKVSAKPEGRSHGQKGELRFKNREINERGNVKSENVDKKTKNQKKKREVKNWEIKERGKKNLRREIESKKTRNKADLVT